MSCSCCTATSWLHINSPHLEKRSAEDLFLISRSREGNCLQNISTEAELELVLIQQLHWTLQFLLGSMHIFQETRINTKCTYHCSTISCHLWCSYSQFCEECIPCWSHHWRPHQVLGKRTTGQLKSHKIDILHFQSAGFALCPMFARIPESSLNHRQSG